ncbi:type IV conjugative transfer system coupling protein TraD [Scandinavium goeteborgense]|uniref:Type IV conjugative transfer system coupling protein TraD n=1 Tax=Scandinavium goeteborgense TaxID=1851514 RepID=A0A4R6E198_SCAGO|nr:type IV conjugative transfer system coupling protein TraD [Scandinavium goeteborgense]TDN51481.1 type IV conjugative transfer system coupling protein TraD [Scandinavium goeteborgense]
MSLKPRDLTQGGQVLLMRLKMFIQVNNAISFYIIMFWIASSIGILFMRVSVQNMMNGIIYWYVKAAWPFMKKMHHQAVLHINYKDARLDYSPWQILHDAYTTWCGQTLKQELVISFTGSLILVFFLTLAVYWFIGNEGRKQSEDEIIGGRVLSDDPKEVTRLLKSQGEASDIRIDALALKKNAEIQNFLMHGTVGAGKSQLMRKILRYLRARGDLVILFDKDCTFTEDFYDESRDILLSPVDARCPNWDLWEECRILPELESISTTLIPSSSGEDPFWQGSARTIFAEGTERMRGKENRSYNQLLITLLSIKLDHLRAFLEGTPASSLVDGKIEKTAISIRSVLTNYVKSLRYLQGIDTCGKPPFTIRDWMKGQADKSRNGWLFIPSTEQYHESLKPLISMWLSIAAASLLSMGENRQRRVWFFYDELPSLHKLPNLKDIIAQARKFGGCFVLGFQSYPQLEDVYGPKAAEGIFDLLNTKFFFRSPSAKVSQFVAKDIGETVRKKFREQTSFGHEQVRDGISYGKDKERDGIVSYSDVQSLSDLACYVTLPGQYPVVKLAMKYEAMVRVADGYLPRDLRTSLDPTVDEQITVRSDEEKAQFDVLFTPSAPLTGETGAETRAETPAAAVTSPTNTAASTAAAPPVSPSPVSPVAASTATTPAAGGGKPASSQAAQSGGTEQDLRQALPAGMNEEGEIVDMDAYDHWVSGERTLQDEMNREEMNINNPVDHDFGHDEVI